MVFSMQQNHGRVAGAVCGRAVLVVDPDPLARLVYRTILVGTGTQVLEAGSAARAAAICRADDIALAVVDDAVASDAVLQAAVSDTRTALVVVGCGTDVDPGTTALPKPVAAHQLLALVDELG